MKHDVRVAATCYSIACICTGYGAVRGHPSAVVSGCVWVFVSGALRWVPLRRSSASRPQGVDLRSRRTRHACRPPGRPCRRDPGLFVQFSPHSLDRDGSGLSIHARASPALLNAGAPGESTSEQVVSRHASPESPNMWSEAYHPTGNRLGCSAPKWWLGSQMGTEGVIPLN